MSESSSGAAFVSMSIDTKSVCKLIETMSAPLRTVAQAKADAKAAIIQAQSEGQVAVIRSQNQSIVDQFRAVQQANLERTVELARLELAEDVSEKPVSPDWVMHFIQGAQNVCDEEMQRLWAKVLAGEVGDPGAYSKRTLTFLQTMEKEEAEFLTQLGSFYFCDENGWPHLMADTFTQREAATRCKGKHVFAHFTAVGVLSEQQMVGQKGLYESRWTYFDKAVKFSKTQEPGLMEQFVMKSTFTRTGRELLKLANPTMDKEYIPKLSEYLKTHYVRAAVDFVEGEEATNG